MVEIIGKNIKSYLKEGSAAYAPNTLLGDEKKLITWVSDWNHRNVDLFEILTLEVP